MDLRLETQSFASVFRERESTLRRLGIEFQVDYGAAVDDQAD